MINLAAYGVLRKSQKLVFGGSELDRFNIQPRDLVCGLLDMTQADVVATAFDKDVCCSFIHFSVQVNRTK